MGGGGGGGGEGRNQEVGRECVFVCVWVGVFMCACPYLYECMHVHTCECKGE